LGLQGVGDFDLVDDGTGTSIDGKTFFGLEGASYPITEPLATLPESYELVNIDCDSTLGTSGFTEINDPITGDLVGITAHLAEGDDATCTFFNEEIERGPALFLIIDQDSIDKDDEPFTTTTCYQYLNPNSFIARDGGDTAPRCGEFPVPGPGGLTTETAINDDIADPGMRNELPFFDQNVGAEMEIQVGSVTDEGMFALHPDHIPKSWEQARPATDGIRNFVGVMDPNDPDPDSPFIPGPGLGVEGNHPVLGDIGPEELLDKIPDVRPLRYHAMLLLLGKEVCALVHDSDISVNYIEPDINPMGQSDPGVLDANLQGAYLGIFAFKVLEVIPFGVYLPLPDNMVPLDQGDDPQEIAKIRIKVLDAKNSNGNGVCQRQLITPAAPNIIDEDTSDAWEPATDLAHGNHIGTIFGVTEFKFDEEHLFDPFDSGFDEPSTGAPP